MKKLIFLLAFLVFSQFSCEGKVGPHDDCLHYGDERCGETDSDEEVALWCDGNVWRPKEYCGQNGVCVMGSDQFGSGAHCVHFY